MGFRCSPLFSFPVRFTPFSRGFEATAFRLSPLEYLEGQTRLPAKVPARGHVQSVPPRSENEPFEVRQLQYAVEDKDTGECNSQQPVCV